MVDKNNDSHIFWETAQEYNARNPRRVTTLIAMCAFVFLLGILAAEAKHVYTDITTSTLAHRK